MGLHHTERRKAVVRIGEELRERGWVLHGFSEDRSDPMTDTYAPAHWDGVATHAKLSGTIVCVDVGSYMVETKSDRKGWPEFQSTPHRKTWHVERDGEILKAGVGLSGCARGSDWKANVKRVVDQIERVAYGPSPSSSTATHGDGVTVEHDRDWTWIAFDTKPAEAVRDRLKEIGARWSRKRQAWYVRRNVPDDELAWLTDGGTDESEAEQDTGPFGYVPGKGDACDYVPSWMEVPGMRETEGDRDAIAVLKLFTPDADFTWYVVEYEATTKQGFGLVARGDPALTELGYFSLAELSEVKGPLGLAPERDKWFRPTPVKALADYQAKWGDNGPYNGPVNCVSCAVCGETIPYSSPSQQCKGEGCQRVICPQCTAKGIYVCPTCAEQDRSSGPLEPPEGWTAEDVEVLLEALEKGPILLASRDAGLPTIHDFDPRHLGFGLFEVSTADYTIQYDAGTQMHRLPSGKGAWSRVRVIEGTYDYPYDEAKAKLKGYLAALRTGTDEVDQASIVEASIEVTESEDDVTADDGPTTDTSADELDQGPEPDNDEATEDLDEPQEPDDGIPDLIEVDLGRTHGWAIAQVARVRGKWLYYALAEQDQDKPDRNGGKIQTYGRGIVWRAVAA